MLLFNKFNFFTRRQKTTLFVFIFLLALFISLIVAYSLKKLVLWQAADRNQNKSPKKIAFAPNQVLVQYKPQTTNRQKKEAEMEVAAMGVLKTVKIKDQTVIFLYQLQPSETATEAVAKLKQNPYVAKAEPNYTYTLNYQPHDPLFSSQWSLYNIGQPVSGEPGKADADIDAPEAWSYEKGFSKPVVVAVIDTGIDPNHPDLAAKLWRNQKEVADNGADDDGNGYIDDIIGYNFVSNLSNPLDDHEHGTHVSGIIAAQADNGRGISGVSFGAKIMSLKAGDMSGLFWLSDILAAVYYAADNGANVINMSFGGPSSSSFFQEAINYAFNRGVVLVAAAGNSYDSQLQYPAAHNNVIGVGATTNTDEKADFSTFNTSVDISAPGWEILSTVPTYYYSFPYTYFSGTSMSAPIVAGVASLLLARYPSFTPEQVEETLRRYADDLGPPGHDNYFGWGRVNANKAVKLGDVQGPVSFLQTPSLSTNQSASRTFRVNWQANDQNGIASYTVAYKVGALGRWRYWLPYSTTTATFGFFTGRPGRKYYFKVRAVDQMNNKGKYSQPRATLLPYNQAKLKYYGVWQKRFNANLYLGDSKYSERKGSIARRKFYQAKRLFLIITKRPDGGYANVYVNGVKVKAVNFYALTERSRQQVLIAAFRQPTSGLLKIKTLSRHHLYSTGYRVEIDGLAVAR